MSGIFAGGKVTVTYFPGPPGGELLAITATEAVIGTEDGVTVSEGVDISHCLKDAGGFTDSESDG